MYWVPTPIVNNQNRVPTPIVNNQNSHSQCSVWAGNYLAQQPLKAGPFSVHSTPYYFLRWLSSAPSDQTFKMAEVQIYKIRKLNDGGVLVARKNVQWHRIQKRRLDQKPLDETQMEDELITSLASGEQFGMDVLQPESVNITHTLETFPWLSSRAPPVQISCEDGHKPRVFVGWATALIGGQYMFKRICMRFTQTNFNRLKQMINMNIVDTLNKKIQQLTLESSVGATTSGRSSSSK
ncbi:hypothetical protein PSTG_16358 [Puccinia striiformis f. sp. tritici PST-78]|uniref:Uncharacterized protein n=1 Tax=Puccinia striiformis f. sp. tritici PST-78 TaxID=1165861 RepID=A0A0L0UTV0_9BASI|nr:hypothetical protein PSTG_16358 [Puccinia striiformis f. sp. tritici PST-78]